MCTGEGIDYKTVKSIKLDEINNETAESDQIKLKAEINIAAFRISLRRVHFMSAIVACSTNSRSTLIQH